MDENKREQVQVEKDQLECRLQQASKYLHIELKVKELYPYFIEYCNQMQLKKQLKQQLQLYNSRLQALQTNTSQRISNDDLKELPIKKQKLTSIKSISQAQNLLTQDMKEQQEKRKVRETCQQNRKQTKQSVQVQKNQDKTEKQENKKIIMQVEQSQPVRKADQSNEQEIDVSSILIIQEALKNQTPLKIQEKAKVQENKEIPLLVKSLSTNDQLQIPQLPTIRRNKSLQKNQTLEEILQMDADEQVEVKMKKLNQIFTKLQENKVQEELKALNKENIIILFSKIQDLIKVFIDLYNSNQIAKIPLDIYGLYVLFKYLKQTKGLSEQMKICKQSIIKLCEIYEDYIPEKILDVKKEGKAYIFKVKWFGFKGEDTWEPQKVLPDKEMLRKKIKEKFG